MRHQHVMHRIVVLVEIVVSGENCSTRQAEDNLNPLVNQALPDYLSTRLQLTHVFSSIIRANKKTALLGGFPSELLPGLRPG